MTDILQFDDVVNRAHELETYITQYQVALKALHAMKEEADKIVGTLHQKKDELSRHEQDLVEYLKKLQLVSQKADALLTPIVDEKQQLDTLSKKLSEAITGIEAIVEERLKNIAEPLKTKQDELEAAIGTSTAAVRTDLDTAIADMLRKQDEALKSISQRVDGNEVASKGLTGALEEYKRTAEQQQKKSVAELQKAVQDLKGLVEKQNRDLSDRVQKQAEELKGLIEKQKEDENALVEQQRKELSGTITELSEKHIKVLEKENAQLKSTINAIIAKLGNVKFKKILGL